MCTATGRCFGGQTQDYSAGGCRVQLDPATAELSQLPIGREVKVAVDWSGHQAVVHADLMPTAMVMRALSFDDRRQVALQFSRRQPLAASA